MKRMMRIVLLALLLTGCAGEKGIIDRDGYQLDTRCLLYTSHPQRAAGLPLPVGDRPDGAIK